MYGFLCSWAICSIFFDKAADQRSENEGCLISAHSTCVKKDQSKGGKDSLGRSRVLSLGRITRQYDSGELARKDTMIGSHPP